MEAYRPPKEWKLPKIAIPKVGGTVKKLQSIATRYGRPKNILKP